MMKHQSGLRNQNPVVMTKSEQILKEVLSTREEHRVKYLDKLLNDYRTEVIWEVYNSPSIRNDGRTQLQLLNLIK